MGGSRIQDLNFKFNLINKYIRGYDHEFTWGITHNSRVMVMSHASTVTNQMILLMRDYWWSATLFLIKLRSFQGHFFKSMLLSRIFTTENRINNKIFWHLLLVIVMEMVGTCWISTFIIFIKTINAQRFCNSHNLVKT